MNEEKFLKINDPIHGFILFPGFIRPIVDSKEFQRLMRIHQLSGTDHVFPGANHTRFEHSLGVAALTQRLISTLREIHHVDLSNEDQYDCIVASLLHDLGHGPFSHNFEDLLIQYAQKDHEDMTDWLIRDSELGDTLTNLGFDKEYIANIATGRISNQNTSKATKGSFLSQIFTSAVNVDSMDYLLRDNYHCGTAGRSIDINRLMLAMDQVEENLLGIDINALIALEGFLLARISSFRTIYFHKTCRAVQIMLSEAMRAIQEEIGLFHYEEPDDFTRWDDYILWTELMRNKASKIILEKIRRRELLKMCYESTVRISDNKIDLQNLGLQLSSVAHIPISQIYIDNPSSPNVPYNHISQVRPNEIYSFRRKPNNRKELVRLEDYSLFFNEFKGHLNLIRVYTWQEQRQKLTRVTKKIMEDQGIF